MRLFPARAGVIPYSPYMRAMASPVPRTRGGDPRLLIIVVSLLYCSPHARG